MEFFTEIQKQTTNHTNNENNDDNDRSKNRNAVEDEPSFENDDSKDVAKLVHEVEKEMRDELKGTTSQGRDIEETNTEEKNAPAGSEEPTASIPSEEPTPSPTSAPKQNYVTEKKLNSPNEEKITLFIHSQLCVSKVLEKVFNVSVPSVEDWISSRSF